MVWNWNEIIPSKNLINSGKENSTMNRVDPNLIEKLNKLSPEMQKTIFWLADNINLANRICRGKALPKEKWEEYIAYVTTNRDNLGIALLAYKHIKDEESKKKAMRKKRIENK